MADGLEMRLYAETDDGRILENVKIITAQMFTIFDPLDIVAGTYQYMRTEMDDEIASLNRIMHTEEDNQWVNNPEMGFPMEGENND